MLSGAIAREHTGSRVHTGTATGQRGFHRTHALPEPGMKMQWTAYKIHFQDNFTLYIKIRLSNIFLFQMNANCAGMTSLHFMVLCITNLTLVTSDLSFNKSSQRWSETKPTDEPVPSCNPGMAPDLVLHADRKMHDIRKGAGANKATAPPPPVLTTQHTFPSSLIKFSHCALSALRSQLLTQLYLTDLKMKTQKKA